VKVGGIPKKTDPAVRQSLFLVHVHLTWLGVEIHAGCLFPFFLLFLFGVFLLLVLGLFLLPFRVAHELTPFGFVRLCARMRLGR
jgi:hypothetical protein